MIIVGNGKVEITKEVKVNPEVSKYNGFKLITESPRVNKYYKIEYKGRVYEGILQRVAMMRTGAVLGFGTWGKTGIPITKHAKWYEKIEK